MSKRNRNSTSRERIMRWNPGGAWNALILILSAYVIVAFGLSFDARTDPEITKLLGYGDTVACIFFLIDVFLRCMASPNRIAFWKYGWIDLVSSIPNFSPMRWGIIFKALRILRAVRVIVSAARISDYFFRDRIKSYVAVAISAMFTSIFVCGSLVLHYERKIPDANIRDAFDAMWWAVNTITTVGTGDVYPMSDVGRIVGMLLMFVGIGLFSSMAAVSASWLARAASQAPLSEESCVIVQKPRLKTRKSRRK